MVGFSTIMLVSNFVQQGSLYPILFRKSLHFLVEEEVDSQCVAGAVGEDGAENLTVLVVHLLRHMQQHCVVDFLNVNP